MTDKQKGERKDSACFDISTCMQMMNRNGMGCDCSQMMSRMAKMNDADDKGWAEMMKTCCSVPQDNESAKDQTNPI